MKKYKAELSPVMILSAYKFMVSVGRHFMDEGEIQRHLGLVSLFNGISTFVGYLMPKSSKPSRLGL